MQKNDIAKILAQTPLFDGLDEKSRLAVAEEMREAGYESGKIIFSRGDEGIDLHIVTKGRVRLSILTSDGRELSFAHVEAPSLFGELAVFDGRPRSADATAVNKVETLTLSKSAFKRLLAKEPMVAEAALKFLSGRLRDADQQLEAIALHSIEVRLARFFLAAAREKNPADDVEQIKIALPISQSELALLVGASRPKVNAALALLEADGAITRKGQQVICDVTLLEERGKFD